MTRSELDHLLRAAGELTGHNRFVLVGSTAIFAWYDRVPRHLAVSREADLFADGVNTATVEHIADVLENIGHLSIFDDTHGYYVDNVGPETAVLPIDWRTRSRAYQSSGTNGVIAVVPHPDDIAASKLYAGREKDLDWIAGAHMARFIDLDQVAARLESLPKITLERRDQARARLEAIRNRPVT